MARPLLAGILPRHLTLTSPPQAQKIRPSTPEALKNDSWMEEIEELDMDHRRLRKVANLSRMTNLRRASFCDNEITRIEGLESCVLLEELLLEENRIVRIEHMNMFSNLRKLDLGRNKLTKTDGLEGLTMLTELSLEAWRRLLYRALGIVDLKLDLVILMVVAVCFRTMKFRSLGACRCCLR